jgi:hypothetical protein
MTTSGVTAWSLTAQDVVKAALGYGILSPGEDPGADELSDCFIRLNGLLKSWSVRGVSLYREQSMDVTTTPGVATVTLNAAVRDISTARLIYSSTRERQLWPMERADYLSMPNKASVGAPTMYYLSRQRDAAVLTLWPVSSAAVTIRLDYDRIPDTVTAGEQTIDIREELLETVYTNLAVLCAPMFGSDAVAAVTAGGPISVAARAIALETAMFDSERPDFYRFEADVA